MVVGTEACLLPTGHIPAGGRAVLLPSQPEVLPCTPRCSAALSGTAGFGLTMWVSPTPFSFLLPPKIPGKTVAASHSQQSPRGAPGRATDTAKKTQGQAEHSTAKCDPDISGSGELWAGAGFFLGCKAWEFATRHRSFAERWRISGSHLLHLKASHSRHCWAPGELCANRAEQAGRHGCRWLESSWLRKSLTFLHSVAGSCRG